MQIAYKLFEVDPKGRLFPLFIGKTKETKMGEWLPAENLPTKGFSHRSGWHIGKIPSAPWLMNAEGKYVSQRNKKWSRKWFIVAFNDKHDYTEKALKQPGKCFKEPPIDGYYRFFEKGRCLWYICSEILVIRELSNEERQQILKDMNFDEKAEFEPYKTAFEKRKETLKRKEGI